MIFPRVLADMEQAHYRFEGRATCAGCGKTIEYWTRSNGQRAAFNEMRDVASLIALHRCHSHHEPSAASLRRHAAFRGA